MTVPLAFGSHELHLFVDEVSTAPIEDEKILLTSKPEMH